MNRLIITHDNVILVDVTDTAISLFLGGTVEIFRFDGEALLPIKSPEQLAESIEDVCQVVIKAGEITSRGISFWDVNKKIVDGKWYIELDSLLSNLVLSN